MGINDFVDIV